MKVGRVAIIYNPQSGRPGRRTEKTRLMVDSLGKRGIEVEAFATNAPFEATTLARNAVAEGADVVVSYGGDGTLNEVLQGVVGSSAAIAVWPGGTANVVAKELCMPRSVEDLAKVIREGKTKRIAVGLARWNSENDVADASHANQNGQSRYFLMFAGIGLDASVARRVNLRLKRRTGQFAYWVEGLKHIAIWKPQVFSIDIDGESYSGVFALIANGKGYGGGLCMAPEARLEEPTFDVFIVPRRPHNLAYLGDLLASARGKNRRPDARTLRAKHVRAHSKEEPWVELDGEVIGPLPMTFDVVPDALTVIVP
jgi:YegS/Rv2252/BmrU family lipid kinase